MHPIVPFARTAYAQGWAASGGPMTERVKAGCVAAVDYAVENADEPDVIEVTLQLGSLEGAWALVYERREQLIADHVTRIKKIWRAITSRLDIGATVTTIRSHAGLTEADTAKTDMRARITAEAQRLLLGIYLDADYRDLQAAVGDALRVGAAEGKAAALAVAAEQQPRESRFGTIGFDFDLAFDHAYASLDRQDWAGLTWIDRIIRGNASDVGHVLADLVAENAPYKDMVGAVRELTGSSDVRAVSMFIDQAMSTALNQGAVDLYRSEGVGSYDVLTAGDARVCTKCEQDEANNPYPVSQPPPVPEHPGCRCAVAAVQPLPSTAFAPYLPQEG
jgi:SPP1 gp7 family putative phage head morphogenesis protein